MPALTDPRAPAFRVATGWGVVNALPPAAPTGLVARRVSESQADLTWDTLPAGATAYEVWRTASDRDNAEWWPPSTTEPYTLVHSGGPGDTSWSDTTLDPSTPYTYRLRAFHLWRPSDWSAWVPLPGPPTLNAYRSADLVVTAAWEYDGDPGAGTTYDLQRSADGGATWTDAGTGLAATSLDLVVTPGETLSLRVRGRQGGQVGHWSGPVVVDVMVPEAATPWPAGVAGGGTTALNPWAKRGYAAATGPGGLQLREFNTETAALLRTLDLSGTPLTQLDAMWLNPHGGGRLYGLQADTHYLLQVNLDTWAVASTLDLSSAGVTKLSGGIAADPARGVLYLSASGAGDPDVVEVRVARADSLAPVTPAVTRVLTRRGVGGARAGALALDAKGRKLHAATMSPGTTGRVAAVNVDSLLQTGQASFSVADGSGNYRSAGTWDGEQAWFGSDSEAASLVKVATDLAGNLVAAATDLPGLGWVRSLQSTGTDVYLTGQDADTGDPESRQFTLPGLAEVARIVLFDTVRPLLGAVLSAPASITVTWNDPYGGRGASWVIRRSVSSSEGPWEFVASVAGNVTTYTDTGLDPNSTYWYQVRALAPGDLVPFLNPFGNLVNSFAGLMGSVCQFAASASHVTKKQNVMDRTKFYDWNQQADRAPWAVNVLWTVWENAVDTTASIIEADLAVAANRKAMEDKILAGDTEGAVRSAGAFTAGFQRRVNELGLLDESTIFGLPFAKMVSGLSVRMLGQAEAADPESAARGTTVGTGAVPAYHIGMAAWALVDGVLAIRPAGGFAPRFTPAAVARFLENESGALGEQVPLDPSGGDAMAAFIAKGRAALAAKKAAAELAARPPVTVNPASSTPELVHAIGGYEGENVSLFRPHAEAQEVYSASMSDLRAKFPGVGRPGHPQVIEHFGLAGRESELTGFSWYLRKVGDETRILIQNGSGRLERGVLEADMPALAKALREFAGVGPEVPVTVSPGGMAKGFGLREGVVRQGVTNRGVLKY
jgi:hypothetical protein